MVTISAHTKEKKMKKQTAIAPFILLMVVLVLAGCAKSQPPVASGGLTDQDIENLVRQSYRFVAMYNVINRNAMIHGSQTDTDGWNQSVADTALKDHTYQAIARPNNDTLYAGSVLDLRAEPVIIEYPAFDTKYAVLETSAYDHYVDIPLSTTKGDFDAPTRILFYSARTEGYSGEPVEGVDIVQEMTADFAGAFLRVMPHAAEPERMQRNLTAMQEVRVLTLSEFLGGEATKAGDPGFPAVGTTDFETFENNFLEVMQFVVNHTTFDPEDPLDQGVLAALAPLGVAPGKVYDQAEVAPVDGRRLAAAARAVQSEAVAIWSDPGGNPYLRQVFLPKGEMTLEPMVVQSAYGPIGLPAHQAVYPGIGTADGEPMNAMHDYVVRMTADELPPATAFWSVTLYDTENGFFIPNDRKKYSVGENAGYMLDEDGGIEIHIAAEQPAGLPEENWLPINRQDEALDLVMRIYAPDLERLETWTPPVATKID